MTLSTIAAIDSDACPRIGRELEWRTAPAAALDSRYARVHAAPTLPPCSQQPPRSTKIAEEAAEERRSAETTSLRPFSTAASALASAGGAMLSGSRTSANASGGPSAAKARSAATWLERRESSWRLVAGAEQSRRSRSFRLQDAVTPQVLGHLQQLVATQAGRQLQDTLQRHVARIQAHRRKKA